jgi:hypothetical protein
MYVRHGQRGADSQYEGYGLATAFGTLVLGLVAVASGFYWLMQPTVVTNHGMTAYKAPPKAVVHYADSPWVPPPPSEALAAASLVPVPEVVEKPAAAPAKETKKREARTTEARTTEARTTEARPAAPRRERPYAERDPRNSFASSPFGFRPWF